MAPGCRCGWRVAARWTPCGPARRARRELGLVSYGQRGTDLLLETPYGFLSPEPSSQLIADLRDLGYRILLAHPERNPTFQGDPDHLSGWLRDGVLLQVRRSDSLDLAPRRSPSRRLALMLIEEGLAHVIASDVARAQAGPRPRAVARRRGRGPVGASPGRLDGPRRARRDPGRRPAAAGAPPHTRAVGAAEPTSRELAAGRVGSRGHGPPCAPPGGRPRPAPPEHPPSGRPGRPRCPPPPRRPARSAAPSRPAHRRPRARRPTSGSPPGHGRNARHSWP